MFDKKLSIQIKSAKWTVKALIAPAKLKAPISKT